MGLPYDYYELHGDFAVEAGIMMEFGLILIGRKTEQPQSNRKNLG